MQISLIYFYSVEFYIIQKCISYFSLETTIFFCFYQYLVQEIIYKCILTSCSNYTAGRLVTTPVHTSPPVPSVPLVSGPLPTPSYSYIERDCRIVSLSWKYWSYRDVWTGIFSAARKWSEKFSDPAIFAEWATVERFPFNPRRRRLCTAN